METTTLRVGIIGCGRPFRIETPAGFVELENQSGATDYEYRSTTPEGVTFGVRVVVVSWLD